MTLGMLVTTARHLGDVIGIANSAVVKGHEVIIFIMDEAVQLLAEDGLQELASRQGVSIYFCDISSKQAGLRTENLPKEIISGSQLNNAMMVRRSDRVISL